MSHWIRVPIGIVIYHYQSIKKAYLSAQLDQLFMRQLYMPLPGVDNEFIFAALYGVLQLRISYASPSSPRLDCWPRNTYYWLAFHACDGQRWPEMADFLQLWMNPAWRYFAFFSFLSLKQAGCVTTPLEHCSFRLNRRLYWQDQHAGAGEGSLMQLGNARVRGIVTGVACPIALERTDGVHELSSCRATAIY